jgi:IclR family transcriptional regulator, KDG regulon repressor
MAVTTKAKTVPAARKSVAADVVAPVKPKRPEPQRLSSVAMAVRLLKSFSEGEAEIGVTTLSRRLGVAKSTVYRLASTLVSEGLLEQNPETERYRLGMALFGLGALVRQRMNVATDARPFLFHLREATGETVHLAILEGAEIVFVLNLESNQAIRMRADLGARKPAFCTAEGRAMLAFQPKEVVDDVLAKGFVPRTPKTIINERAIRKAIDEARAKGFAVEDEQSELGMRSVAAPIRNANGRVIAAIGLAGPMQRISDEALASFAPLVADAARTISARLGFNSLAG